jgi:hypothetical protein
MDSPNIKDIITNFFGRSGIEADILTGAPDPRQLTLRLKNGNETRYLTLSWETIFDEHKLGAELLRARDDILGVCGPSHAIKPKTATDTPFRIIAVDFDGCLCENAWPNIGRPIWSSIYRAKEEREAGSKIILWTCRRDEMLTNAVEACQEWGLEFDAVILSDVSYNKYSLLDMDAKLLYVAMTRAMHIMDIHYTEKISPLLEVSTFVEI